MSNEKLPFPVLRLEFEGLRHGVMHAINLKSDELNEMIQKAVDEYVTVENLQGRINLSVSKAMDKAIEDIADNYAVREAVMAIVRKALLETADKMHDDGQ